MSSYEVFVVIIHKEFHHILSPESDDGWPIILSYGISPDHILESSERHCLRIVLHPINSSRISLVSTGGTCPSTSWNIWKTLLVNNIYSEL